MSPTNFDMMPGPTGPSAAATAIASSAFSAIPPPDRLIGRNPIRVRTSFGVEGVVIGDPTHPDLNNPAFVPPHVTICSVWPEVLFTPFNALKIAGKTQFVIPQPPTEGFSCLRVYDAVAVIGDIEKIGDRDYNGPVSHVGVGAVYSNSEQRLASIPALTPAGNGGIAFDIVHMLSMTMVGASTDCRRGLGIIKGDLPTEAELAHFHRIQKALFTWYYEEAGEFAEQRKWKSISRLHRFAAQQLGESPAWLFQVAAKPTKPCISCTKPIPTEVTGRCEHCGTDLLEFAMRRSDMGIVGLVTAESDRFLWPLLDMAMKAREGRPQANAAPPPQAQQRKPAPASTAPAPAAPKE